MADQINVPIVSKYDDKGAKQALKDVKELDKLKPEVKVTADTAAATKSIDGLMKKVDLLDKDAATILLTSNATDIASDVAGLLIDLDKLDADDPEVTVKATQINGLKGDLDQIEAKIREVNGIAVAPDVDAGGLSTLSGDLDQVEGKIRSVSGTPVTVDASGATAGLHKMRGEADQSRSVLANMAGNAAQDIGAVGGAAGTAGVAIGQLAEYATEGGIGLAGLAGAAGPMLVLGVAVQAITSAFQKEKAAAEEAEKRTADLFKAMEHGQTILDTYSQTVEETGQLKFLGKDVLPDLARFNLGLDDFTGLLQLNKGEQDAWFASMSAGMKEGSSDYKALFDIALSLWQATEDQADATGRLTTTQQALADVNAAKNAEELNQAYRDAANPMATFNQLQEDATEQIDRVNQLLLDEAEALNGQVDAAIGAADAMVELDDAQQGFIDKAGDATQAAKDYVQAVREHGQKSTEAAEAARHLKDAERDQAKAAYDAAAAAVRMAQDNAAAGGKTLTAKGRVDAFNTSLLSNAHFATPAARSAIGDYIVKANQVPASKATAIKAAIDSGDFATAQRLLNEASRTRTAAIHADADTATAERELDALERPRTTILYIEGRQVGALRDRGGFVGPEGAIVAERRPEFVRLPGGQQGLVTEPSFVPSGTQVTSGAETERILAAQPSAPSAPVTNVTVNVPRGYHGDVLEDARKAARRSGGLYQRNGR